MEKYDSTADTLLHIKRVSTLLNTFSTEMLKRANIHDDSKLKMPEKELFDKMTPLLASVKYGTPEYKQMLEELKPALDHHYSNNSHHPEFYKEGIDGMNLFDIVEMFCDWWAATERTKEGNLLISIDKNKDRFNMNEQLCNIFKNTADIMNYKSKTETE